MMKNIYFYILSFCLFVLYVWVDKNHREGLQNYDNSRQVKYENMHDRLIENSKLKRMLKEKPLKPCRSKYFKSNLTSSEETQKDFAYFNNASSIFAGYSIFSVP